MGGSDDQNAIREQSGLEARETAEDLGASVAASGRRDDVTDAPRAEPEMPTAAGWDARTQRSDAAARDLASPSGLALESRIGEYELIEEIARGGMGVVYKARQTRLNRIVAVKMMLGAQFASEAGVRRFRLEAEAAAHLDHPNIVPIFEVAEHAGRPYFSMGYVDGESLGERVASGPLAPKEAARMVRIVALAIQYAHDQGVIHRDLKPANVLVDRGGAVRVTDFGLAKRTKTDSGLTATGEVMGTPSYMPPEQATGQGGQVGPAADIYSLGALLYCLITGRPPFQAASVTDTLLQVINQEPVPPRRLNAAIDRDLDTICLKCLEKEPRNRYESARMVADELGRFLAGEPIAARPVNAPARAWRWCKRKPGLAVLGGISTWLLLLVSFATLFGLRQQELRKHADLTVAATRQIANQARETADEARRATEVARRTMKEEKRRSVGKIYNSSISMAHQALLKGDFARGIHLLDTSPFELRNWEWRYLNRKLTDSQLLILDGNSVAVLWAEFAADGRAIFSADATGVFKLRDATTGDVLRSIPAGQGPLAADAGRKFLVSSTQTGELRLWDLRLLKANPKVLKAIGMIPSIGALSPDCENLALAGFGASDVRLYSVERNTEIGRLKGRADTVSALAISPNGRLLGVGRDNGWVDIWEIETKKRRHEFRGHSTRDATIKGIAFSADSKRLATASIDGTAKVFTVDDGRLELALRGNRRFLLGVAFSPDGRLLATAGSDRTSRLWDTETGEEVTILAGHENMVTMVDFSPDGTRLLTASLDTTIRVWDVPKRPTEAPSVSSEKAPSPTSDRPDRLIPGRPAAVSALAFHPDGRRLASAYWDGFVRIDDLETGRAVLSIPVNPGTEKKGADAPPGDSSLGAIAYSRDGKTLAVGRGGLISETKGVLYMMDGETGRILAKTAALSGPISALAFSPDGRRLLVATGNVRGLSAKAPTVGIFDSANAAQLTSYKGHSAAVLDAAWSHDGKLVASCGFNQGIRIWDPGTGKEIKVIGERNLVRGVAFSTDDSIVAGAGTDAKVHIYEINDGKERPPLTGHTGEVYRLTFSPDAKRLASAGADSTVRIWDVASGDELLTLSDHSNEVYDLEFSPDGRLLASAGLDATIRVYSAGAAVNPADAEAWPVIFSDAFERAELGDAWKTLGGRWSIESGAARGVLEQMAELSSPSNAAAIVPQNLALPSTVELRFDCWTPHPIVIHAELHDTDLDPLRGCGFLLMGVPRFPHPFVTSTAIAAQRSGAYKSAGSNPRFVLEKDIHYRVRLLHEPGRVSVSVDGEEVVSGSIPDTDLSILQLLGSSGAAGDTVYFDNLEVRAPAATAAERAALARVAELYTQDPIEADVPARLQDDPKLDAPTRKLALAIAARRQLRAETLNNDGYLVAVQSGRSDVEYQDALRRLDEAHRLVPKNGNVLDSLGVAQLRVGQYQKAFDSLSRAQLMMRSQGQTAPPTTNLAFQAIAQSHLGHRAEAEKLLDWVGELMGSGGEPGQETSSVRDEAQAVIKSTAATDRERVVRSLWAVSRGIGQYYQDNKVLPPAAIFARDGRPLLSWRVAILPYIGQKELFEQFHRDEPWDSPHNLTLIKKIPQAYKRGGSESTGDGKTVIQAFVGGGTSFDGRDGLAGEKLTDGISSTLLVAEAAEAVNWTEPVDLMFTGNDPLPRVGSLQTGRVSILFADGVVMTAPRDRLDAATLRAFITRAGGEKVDRSNLSK
jgi:WD40 repeat protein/tRNA A-37 threonylcarbamoyl transferase component Bud32/tetratricopeptide (TPR) repeat protein